ncbi:glucan endo-1 3-beta-glucosidase acidic isoform pr-q' [Phtheirospermum japonicum]|uniref:Glucan endo-1 3-beta-glucosidase acidic isoform pr-q n=1 Tax=Phtheirospermum japonicum TaxID=374723 RepID=A0A830B2R8_9LAMI|nr:glucan endo-1 3-beta-glucosidase acidic isoform pr-q' [Phtheirospermum japonicum]
MAIAANHFMSAMLMLGLLIIALSLDFTVAQVGVDYGRNGQGLPLPSRVVELYNQFNIRRMRIYDTDRDTLTALRGSNIELTVGILNPDLQPLAEDPAHANNWVRDNIMNYPDVKFRHVVVGNEVRPGKPDTQQYVPFVLQAMQNIYNAISPLQRDIKVTTAVDTEIIDPASNFPPENGRFRPEVAPYLDPIVRFLVDTNAPLFANIYPYFAYLGAPDTIDLQYALLNPDYPGIDTPSGNYKNLFFALLDTPPPEVRGGESGWSSRRGPPPGLASTDAAGDGDVANIENARAYVNNLIQAVKNGTPRRPGQPIETYIFAMFDENLKPGNEEERNFGLFTPGGEPKYPVNFN